MSSRGQFVGSGPVAGIYQPTPVPREEKDLSAYINDELLNLGGRLNSVLEGGAFPPQSEMPRRWREGMMIYFTRALDAIYPDTKEPIITSAGIWLFKKGKWWKIIDDPTDIVGGLTYYCLQPNSNTPPTKPDTGVTLPPVSPGFTWEEVPPEKPDKTWFIYSTTLVSYTETSTGTYYEWSIPTIWSGGVTDGADGKPGDPGAPGIDGRTYEAWFKESDVQPFSPDNKYPPGNGWVATTPDNPTKAVWVSYLLIGENGTNPAYPWSFPVRVSGEAGEIGPIGPVGPDGADGRRGTLNISIQGTSWSSQAAYNAIANDANGDGKVYYWDTVTITDSAGSTQFSEMRYYTGGGNPGTWKPLKYYIDGDVIVNGTIGTDQIAANAITAGKIAAGAVTAGTISAGAITANEIASTANVRIGGTKGDDWVILSPNDPNSRIWVGPSNAGASANFRVAPNGDLYANSGYFGGNVQANNLIGAVSATKATLVEEVTFVPSEIGGSSGVDKEMLKITVERDPDREQIMLIKIFNFGAEWHSRWASGSPTVWDAVSDITGGTGYLKRNDRKNVAECYISTRLDGLPTGLGSTTNVLTYEKTVYQYPDVGNNEYNHYIYRQTKPIELGPLTIPKGSGKSTAVISVSINAWAGNDALPQPPNLEDILISSPYTGQATAVVSTHYIQAGHIEITK